MLDLQRIKTELEFSLEVYNQNNSSVNLNWYNLCHDEWVKLTIDFKIRSEERLRNSHLFRARNHDSAWKLFQKLMRKSTPTNFQVASMIEHFTGVYNPSGRPLVVRRMTRFCYAPLSSNDAFFDNDFTLEDLEEALRKLNRAAAVGPQRISSNTIFLVLQNNSEAKSLFLHLFNNCFNMGTIPLDWAHSEFFVLFKGKGDPNVSSNYQGIALQNDFFRVYERLINLKFYPWGIQAGVFGLDQCGFRHRRCTFDVSFSLHSAMLFYTRCLSISVAAVFIDFKKAFPSVNRQALIDRLQTKGCPSKLLNAIAASLSLNTYSLKFDDNISEPFPVTSGTKEGGINSPAIFNSIVSLIWEEGGFQKVGNELIPSNSYAFAFADDVVCFSSNPGLFQDKLDWLVEKMAPFNLELNEDKTEQMTFHASNSNRTQFNLTVRSKQLKKVSVFVHVGFRIRDDLGYICQFEHIRINSIKIAKRVGSLISRLNITDLSRIRMYFYSFVSSQFFGLPLLPDVSVIYKHAASVFLKACFCLPVSLSNCAAIHLLSPKSSFLFQMQSKVNFFNRVIMEFKDSSVINVLQIDLDFLFEKRCGWAFTFLTLLEKISVVPNDLVFDSLEPEFLTECNLVFWEAIERDLFILPSLEVFRDFLGTA
ncbi:MAG: hypothetical protein RI955_1218 [Bacteroidota bacterium]